MGLTENPKALLRWMVAGPETGRVIQQFENTAVNADKKTSTSYKHHEQSRGVQVAFDRDVKALVETFNELGNLFLEQSTDILVLDTKEIADSAMTSTVRQTEKYGKEQYETDVTERLVEKKKKHSRDDQEKQNATKTRKL